MLENVYDDGTDIDQQGTAYGLVRNIETYQFAFIAHLMRSLLGITNVLSQFLQKKNLDIIEAMNLVRSCKKRIQRLRENGWDQLVGDVNKFCAENKLAIVKMEDTVNDRLHCRNGNITNYHYYRVQIFCQVIYFSFSV